jgi:hypothetical protein
MMVQQLGWAVWCLRILLAMFICFGIMALWAGRGR